MSKDLMAAARIGDLETLRAHRARLLEEAEDYPSFVWQAALEADQVGVLELCLEAGLDPNGTPESRPLLEAARSGAKHCLQRLLAAGADPRLADEDGRDLLLIAVSMQDRDLVRLALERGGNPFGESMDLLLTHVPQDLAKAVRQARADLKQQYASLLAAAEVITKGGTVDRRLTAEEIDTPIPLKRGATLMHLAARADNAEALRTLAAMGGNPNSLDQTVHERRYGRGTVLEISSVFGGRTPLMVAASHGRESAVRTLLDLGADVHLADPKGETALHLACRQGRESIIEMLLGAGADPNAVTEEGAPPLLIAGYFGSAGVVRRLLEAGAAVDQADHTGVTPFLAACWEGRTKQAQLLLQHGARVDASSEEGDVWDALHAERRTKTLKSLLPHLELNPEGREQSPLAAAAAFFHLEAVPMMVKAGARLKPGEQVNLIDAWGVDLDAHVAAVAAMAPLSGGIAPDALYRAARADNLDLVGALLELGADPQGPPPALAQSLKTRIIRLLLQSGADVDSRDESGRTALAWAVLEENLESVKLLLEQGADPGAEDREGIRPVDLAALSPPAIQKLFAAHNPYLARVGSLRLQRMFSDYDPPTPAEVASALDQGGDPNLTVGRGFSLLQVAAAARNWDAADLLLIAGASPDWKADALLGIRKWADRDDGRFRAEVAVIEALVGEEAQPVEGGFGAVAFRLDSQVEAMKDRLTAEGMNRTLADISASRETVVRLAEQVRPRFTSGWCGSWRCHPIGSERLLCVPTGDPYEVVALIQPHAGEHDVGVFEILDFLKRHEPLGWKLVGLGYDTLDLEFASLPADLAAFAQELYGFCPDLIDQGFESLNGLETHLKTTRRLHLWWD
ncbi:MAG: ankyrin repeat domain-containing protein [Fimbriimonadaceae bacterium]|nr:ankyrin repeat domain-containing protein [Fimbriimonadaceae bacterium]